MPATASPPTKKVQIALDYGLRGLKVVPIHDVRDGHCTCRLGADCPEPGTHLVPEDGTNAATSESLQINRWWRKFPAAAIAVVTGPPSGVWALLVRGEASQEALQQLESQHGPLPRTARLRCGDDLVYLFAWPSVWEVPSRDEIQGLPLETFGADAWVRLPAGDEDCTWDLDFDHSRVAQAPDWLLVLLNEPEAPAEEPAAGEELPEEDAPADKLEPGDIAESQPAEAEYDEPRVAKTKSTRKRSCAESATQAADGWEDGATFTVANQVYRIDLEFAHLLPPMSAEEQAQLEQNLLAVGRCLEPLIVWDGLLIEGHHRLKLCLKHDLPFTVEELDLADRETAKGWMVDHQLGKRNLSREQASYLRGLRYELEKEAHGGDRRSKSQSETLNATTAKKLAEQYQVSRATIMRDAEYARNITAVTRNCGETARPALLAKRSRLTRQRLQELADLAPMAQQSAVRELAETGRWRLTRPARSSSAKSKKKAAPTGQSLTLARPLKDAQAQAQQLVVHWGRKVALAFHAALGEILGLGCRGLARPRRARGKR